MAYLGSAVLWIPGEDTVVHQFFWLAVTCLLRIQRGKHVLELVLLEDELGNVPLIYGALVDAHVEAGNDAEVVARSAHSPPEIGVRGGVDRNGGAISQDNVHRDQQIDDQAVEALIATVPSTKAWTHDTDTRATPGTWSCQYGMVSKLELRPTLPVT